MAIKQYKPAQLHERAKANAPKLLHFLALPAKTISYWRKYHLLFDFFFNQPVILHRSLPVICEVTCTDGFVFSSDLFGPVVGLKSTTSVGNHPSGRRCRKSFLISVSFCRSPSFNCNKTSYSSPARRIWVATVLKRFGPYWRFPMVKSIS